MRRLLPSRAHVIDGAVVVLILALCVVGWDLYVRLGHVDSFILPSPRLVATTFWAELGDIASGAGATTESFVLGFVLAAAVGVALAIVIVTLPRIGRGIYPLVVASQTVPVIAIAPLLIIWLGFGIWPKVVVSALIAFFPIVVTSVVGFRSVGESSIQLMRSIPAGKTTLFRKLMIPAALPSMFAGFRTAAVLSVIGAVVGEFVAGGNGLAASINLARASFDTARVMADILALSVLGIVFYFVVALAERVATPWRFHTVRPQRSLYGFLWRLQSPVPVGTKGGGT